MGLIVSELLDGTKRSDVEVTILTRSLGGWVGMLAKGSMGVAILAQDPLWPLLSPARPHLGSV